VRLALYGMTVREQLGRTRRRPLLDRVADGEPLEAPADGPDLRGYVELALRSGFPEAALAMSANARRRWLESYLEQVLTRDAAVTDGGRDPVRLRRWFQAVAMNTAGVIDDKTLYEAAGINRKTAMAYEALLTRLLLVDAVPAWWSNRLKRLLRAPKRYVVDAALVAAALGLDVNAVLRDGRVLGSLLDTFVAAQLRAELPVGVVRPRLYHLRQEHGRHEVDLVAELNAERVVAIEVKADAAPARDAAKHLAWLREALGERFVAGVVLHTGPRTYALGDGIVAAPIATLWA
jgi:predicted AAA+ superfamily ATPase